MTPLVLIVGFGNTLAGDDGAGAAVVDRLIELGLPRRARAETGGSDALVLTELWQGEERVWIVDAVTGGRPPGTLHMLGHRRLLALPQRHDSAHRLSLAENLRWVLLLRPEMRDVRFRLCGIEPGQLHEPDRLTPVVARAVVRLAEWMHNELIATCAGPGPGSEADRAGVVR